MHLNDRHGAHLTLQTKQKQAGLSVVKLECGSMAAGFHYGFVTDVDSKALTLNIVSIHLHGVTNFCQSKSRPRPTAEPDWRLREQARSHR
jgi:hypothetical protein